ncbi:MAG: phospholipid carrier-dependent glycosyltransferase [Deltaproteobacteria bacterium]|nr:MAG: phospholipid carrier-dependent glycosyltransferase [Deltaproteobacteria bacterium]
MESPKKSVLPQRLITALVLSAAALLYWPSISGTPFYTKGEPREAIVVQAIIDTGEFILPLRNGNEIPSKPPLFHWLGALVSAAEGTVDEATVRLPSLLASLSALYLVLAVGAALYGRLEGLLAAAVLATSVQWLASSTTARVDMVLAASLTGALCAAWQAIRDGGTRLPAAFFACSSLAVLAKGPVGYVLPALIVAVHVAVSRDRRLLAMLRPPRAAWLWLLPVLWYAAAAAVGGRPFIDKLLLKENLYRVLDPDAVSAGHVHGALYYLPALLGGLAPWSLLAPWVGTELWRKRPPHTLFPLVWFLVTIGFYSLAGSKRGVYLLSAYPAAAWLIGRWLAGWLRESRPLRRPAARTVATVLAIPALVASALAAGLPVSGALGPLLSSGDAANLAAIARAAAARPAPIFLASLLAVVLAVATGRALAAGARRPALGCIFAFVLATELVLGSTAHRALAVSQSVGPMISSLRQRMANEGRLYFYRDFEYAAVFYARRPIPRVERFEEVETTPEAWLLLREPDMPRLAEEVAAAAARRGTRLVVERAARFDYNGNPRRAALIAVRVTDTRDNEQPG